MTTITTTTDGPRQAAVNVRALSEAMTPHLRQLLLIGINALDATLIGDGIERHEAVEAIAINELRKQLSAASDAAWTVFSDTLRVEIMNACGTGLGQEEVEASDIAERGMPCR